MNKTESTTRRLSPDAVALEWILHGENWQYSALLSADQHFDSPDCNRKLLKRHLDEAVRTNAAVFFLGDFFDAMQSPHDKRRSYSELQTQHKVDAYLNSIVDEAADFLSPYSAVIKLIAHGNHETALIKHQGVDLVRLLVDKLNAGGGAVEMGGYAGWVMMRGYMNRKIPKRGSTLQTNIYYTHGSGGNSPVTRGVIKSARRAVTVPDAHVVCSGHIHQSWILEVPRVRLSRQGVAYTDTQWHLQLPTYKETRTGSGWAAEKEMGASPLGAWWLDMRREKRDNGTWIMKLSPRRAA